MLGEPPKQDPRAKRASGADLAAALASASTPAGTNGSAASAVNPATTQVGLPPATFASTAVGVPKLDEWQDGSVPAHAPPPAAAPVVPIESGAPTSAASMPGSGSVPMTPLPPVLPSGSAALRSDKSTIAVSVPPQVKVATVDARHVEPKQPALIVEDKPPAMIVDTPPPALVTQAATAAAAAHAAAEAQAAAAAAAEKPAALIIDTPPTGIAKAADPVVEKPAAVIIDTPPAGIAKAAADAAAISPAKLETMTTLVDARPPEIEVPKLVDGRLPEPVKQSAVATLAVAPVAPAPPAAAAASIPGATPARAGSQSDAVPSAQGNVKSSPHPAAAVALGPIPGSTRDSKDVLAGWGWGTDKHTAIPPALCRMSALAGTPSSIDIVNRSG